MSVKETVDMNTCCISLLASVFLTFSYVASLYVWKSSHSRDHPSTIKRRFFSVSCMMVIAPFVTKYFLLEERRTDVLTHLGLRWPGLFLALVLPLLLTIILFLGPLTMHFFSGVWTIYFEPYYWITSWQDLVWVRNHFVAPLSEEWVFRSCMMPLLLQCLHPYTAVYVGPLLFGVAHFHHMFEQMKAGFEFKTALMISDNIRDGHDELLSLEGFQFMYTSLFGAYSAYLFVRTGHFVAPLLAHIFCNHMGFPNFTEIRQHKRVHQIIITINFLLGFSMWCFLLSSMTHPALYDNTLLIEP